MPIVPQISSQHVTGFVVGLGVAATGFYFYGTTRSRVGDCEGVCGFATS